MMRARFRPGGPRGVLAALGAVVVLAVSACAAEEQGGLEGASPGPDAVVGGEIDRIELLYDNIVVAVDGSLVGPDGADVPADFVVDTDIRALVELDSPLDTPGEYIVRPVVEAVDGVRVDDAYAFVYEPSAPPPQFVFRPDDEGAPWLAWVVATVGALVVVVLLVRLLASLRRLRSQTGSR